VDATDDQDAPANASAKATRSRKKQSRASAIEAIAEQVVQEAVSGRGNNRRQARLETPENAEEIQIDPEEVSMGDLVKDNKLGRKSETEKRMRENWQDIKRRRQEEIERRRAAAGSGRHGRQALAPTQDVPVDAQDLHVPQQIIVNGQIVVAAESREVAFGAGVEKAVIEDADVALEDDRIYKYVHQGTLGKHAGRKRATRWDDEQTELFYKGLRMFGTDFAMIANLFPDWDRKQIKLKYIAEDRVDSRRVQECVAAKEPVDLEEYSKMANQEFEDPDKLLSELAAEERRLREEDDRRRANEGYVLDGADIPLPSTERDPNEVDDVVDQDVGAGTAARTQAASTDHRDRVSALADNIVAAATGPKRKQTQQRKIKESAGRGRQAKKGRRPMEGVEERIGPIDEVER
jgi:transcription factor TFIIIB component B''